MTEKKIGTAQGAASDSARRVELILCLWQELSISYVQIEDNFVPCKSNVPIDFYSSRDPEHFVEKQSFTHHHPMRATSPSIIPRYLMQFCDVNSMLVST
eukprot:1161493-Pelagomonas_calceolata.AAC.4